MSDETPLLLTILGPTACGKTSLAVAVADRLDGEIISADSRQVFRGMDIGTGKDLSEYDLRSPDGTLRKHIPCHLIDICDAGEEYNVYKYLNAFIGAFNGIVERGRQPIMCGGTGLYLEAVIRAYRLPDAPIDEQYRHRQEAFSDEELTARLASLIPLHNHTDTETRERLLRALEIQEYRAANPDSFTRLPAMRHLVVGISYPREAVVERIGIRLRQRLENGMIEEVQTLLDNGVPAERLLKYGLEYKQITRYLTGQIDYCKLYEDLYTDIRRFSKRQMTWFRRMERNGVAIHWLDGQQPATDKVAQVLALANRK